MKTPDAFAGPVGKKLDSNVSLWLVAFKSIPNPHFPMFVKTLAQTNIVDKRFIGL